MNIGNLTRRDFVKGAGILGLGSSAYFLVFQSGKELWKGSVVRRTLPALGTRVVISVFDAPEAVALQAIREAFTEIELIHRLMSTHEPGSHVSWINRAAGNEWVHVDPRVTEVVGRSLEFSRSSSGIFDPTLLPLLKAWGFRGYRFDQPPDEGRILSALERVGYGQIVVSKQGVGLKRRGAEIDLGGIAKGYAVDRAVRVLQGFGVGRAIVVAGGDLRVLGRPPEAEGYQVGIRHPIQEGRVCATLRLSDQAVATSGIYESFVTHGGRHWGHLIDPRTGQPVDTFLSTTAVAPSALEADAASTTLFVAGREGGADLIPHGISWLHITGSRTLNLEASGSFPAWEAVT